MLGQFWCRSGYLEDHKSDILHPSYPDRFVLHCIWAKLVKPIFYSSDYRPQREVEDEQPGWMNDVEKPVLEFLSNVDEHCLYAQVPEEMVIQLSGPETANMDDDNQNMPNNIQQLCFVQE